MWGHPPASFFTSVSPEMHDEFSIAYERPWMERFGLSYYGCCERLDIKMDQLRQIKI